MRHEIDNINHEGSTFIITDILKNIGDIKVLIRELADLKLKIEGIWYEVFGPDYKNEFECDLDEPNNVMNTCVRELM